MVLYTTDTSSCDLYTKARLAQQGGAAGVVFYTTSPGSGPPNPRVREVEWTPDSYTITIPAIGVSYAIGSLLAASNSATVSIQTNTEVTTATTYSIFAESVQGDSNSTVVITAHLDSVPAGN